MSRNQSDINNFYEMARLALPTAFGFCVSISAQDYHSKMLHTYNVHAYAQEIGVGVEPIAYGFGYTQEQAIENMAKDYASRNPQEAICQG